MPIQTVIVKLKKPVIPHEKNKNQGLHEFYYVLHIILRLLAKNS